MQLSSGEEVMVDVQGVPVFNNYLQTSLTALRHVRNLSPPEPHSLVVETTAPSIRYGPKRYREFISFKERLHTVAYVVAYQRELV